MKDQAPKSNIKRESLRFRKMVVNNAIAQQRIEGNKSSPRDTLRDLNLIAKGEIDTETAIRNVNKFYKLNV